MATSLENLSLDQRKWRLFLEIGRRELPEGYTKETIWAYRLEEARQHFTYIEPQKIFPAKDFQRMLLIGCGTGAEIKAAQELGYQAVGVGLLSEDQLRYAKSLGVSMKLMDMHDLKFPNNSFDIVCSNYSFEHCVHPWLVCTEVYAVLRDYGRWWLDLATWQSEAKDGPTAQETHFMVLQPWFMRPMFRESGFKILYEDDNKLHCRFLLEKQPLAEVETKFEKMGKILRKRIEMEE